MPRVSFAFFTFAAMSGIVGTIWGSYMGDSGNHASYVAHAHFNLLGWVSSALIGGFYALAAGHYRTWLAWANFALHAIGAICLSIAMIYLMAFGDQRFVPLVIAGSLGTILSMLCFLVAVLASWRSSARSRA